MSDADFKKTLAKARKSREAANDTAANIQMELVRFDSENAHIDFNVDWSSETVWASQRQMADLFGRDIRTINEHVSALIDSGEIDPGATIRKFRMVRLEGGRQVAREIDHYNLDVVLTIGYRVSSAKAVEFRTWANKILRSYIADGFALNERRLRDDPTALQSLAARVRALRSEEKNIYGAVRACFKEVAADYSSNSPAVKSFYSKVQDRFLYAATGKTASQLILSRADGLKPNMGLTVIEGDKPKKSECRIGKNYLFSDELYVLHILCEQFLLFAESKALRGQKSTMADLTNKIDQLFSINEYPVFPGYTDYLRAKAEAHAEAEWNRLTDRLKIEAAA